MRGMRNSEITPVVTESPGLAGKLVPVLVIGGLIALAGGFWAANGPSVFAELMSAAWALCF